jgi:hypothetical protein
MMGDGPVPVAVLVPPGATAPDRCSRHLATLAAVREVFDGPITFVEDGDRFAI